MPSPFPGMDPYLEGWLWPDLHHRLGTAIANALSDQLSDEYVVLVETSVRDVDVGPEEIATMFPDVSVVREESSKAPRAVAGGVAVVEPAVSVPVLLPLPTPATHLRVQLRDGSLVTAIEIMSPANKDAAGVHEFKETWTRLRRSGVHLIEIDLLRRGQRICGYQELSAPAYLIAVTRAGSNRTDAWPFGIRERIPAFPVPLRGGDPDAIVEMQPLPDRIYQQARYGSAVDYSLPPPPPALSAEDAVWVSALTRGQR